LTFFFFKSGHGEIHIYFYSALLAIVFLSVCFWFVQLDGMEAGVEKPINISLLIELTGIEMLKMHSNIF